jgi:hypothetical protein
MANVRTNRGTLLVSMIVPLLIAGLVTFAPSATAASKTQPCHKMTGQVLLTYHNPDTIIMGTGNGMNIATVFTMAPTTTYSRNNIATTLDGIKYLDIGYITYQAIYPSGTLMACTVVMNGP